MSCLFVCLFVPGLLLCLRRASTHRTRPSVNRPHYWCDQQRDWHSTRPLLRRHDTAGVRSGAIASPPTNFGAVGELSEKFLVRKFLSISVKLEAGKLLSLRYGGVEISTDDDQSQWLMMMLICSAGCVHCTSPCFKTMLNSPVCCCSMEPKSTAPIRKVFYCFVFIIDSYG